jgi:hypothetical protein
VEGQFGWPGALDQPRERRNGAEIWSLGDEAFVARRGPLLVASNERELVIEVLDLAEPAPEAHDEGLTVVQGVG